MAIDVHMQIACLEGLRLGTDPVVNSPMVVEKTDRSLWLLETAGIDRVVIVAFVTVAKMDSD